MLDDFGYELPDAAIAQRPLADRTASRLLVDSGDAIEHRTVAELPSLVRPGDVVVVNDTRVRPVRLRLHKSTGGAVEVLLLEPLGDDRWEALVKPSRRVADGTELRGPGMTVVVHEPMGGSGTRRVQLRYEGDLDDALAQAGEMPLPPYIHERLEDADRYQTVFARSPGSAAAPTAGLHFTPELLDRIRAAGAQVVTIDLSVGLDTFRPIMADSLDDHRMHSERYAVPKATWEACAAADRVIAVGTTVVRALESAAASGELAGRTELFIRAGHEFAVVDLLMTNFHMPGSTLLVMIDAFVGPRWRELYAAALADGYRFLSFGDAVLLTRL